MERTQTRYAVAVYYQAPSLSPWRRRLPYIHIPATTYLIPTTFPQGAEHRSRVRLSLQEILNSGLFYGNNDAAVNIAYPHASLEGISVSSSVHRER